jgi:hypothetical protein
VVKISAPQDQPGKPVLGSSAPGKVKLQT